MAGLVAFATIIGSLVMGAGAVRLLRIVGAGIGTVALVFAFLPILHLMQRGRPTEAKSYLHTTTLVDSGRLRRTNRDSSNLIKQSSH